MAALPNSEEQRNPLNNWLSNAMFVRWEVIIYIIILVFAIFTRFHVLGERVMSHDESLHTRYSYNLYADGNFQHTPLMHGPVLFHATAFSYHLFGADDFSSRIYAAALGVMLVMFPILFRRWLGRWGAVIASTLLLISPLIMYYNRYIRHDTPSILFGMIMVYCVMMYINGPERLRRRSRWLYILAIAMILNLGSKETAFIYIAIILSFLILYFAVRVLQQSRGIPGKRVFYTLIMGILFGGVLALGAYTILDVVPLAILPGAGVPFGEMLATEQLMVVIWIFVSLLVFVGFAILTAIRVYRGSSFRIPWQTIGILFLIAIITCFALIFIEERSHLPNNDAEDAAETVISWFPMIALWAGAIIGGGLLIFSALDRRSEVDGDTENWSNVRRRGRLWRWLDQFPEFDLILVIVTMILPWATAVIPFAMHPGDADYIAIAQGLPEFVRTALLSVPQIGNETVIGQFALGFMAWLPLMVLSIIAGLIWNARKWLITWAIFHIIFAFFFTTVFTNIAGLASGMVHSLGYWLQQQGVRRGSQPQYYYTLIILPFYEFLPVIGSLWAMAVGSLLFWRRYQGVQLTEAIESSTDLDQVDDPEKFKRDEQLEPVEPRLFEISFLLLVSWWAILNLVGYSLAGEKMPWLGTHMTTPMILLTGWVFGRMIDRIDITKFRQQGWVLLILFPILLITAMQVLAGLLLGPQPFQGLTSGQLQTTYSWLASFAIMLVLVYVTWRFGQRVGAKHVRRMMVLSLLIVLSVVTFRSAWIASFINFDSAREYLVYAHAAPAVKTVLDDIEEWSLRTTDGYEIKFAYDNEVSWPYSWYFRNYTNAVFTGANPNAQNLQDAMVIVVGSGNRSKVEPIVEGRYQVYEYNRLWWPMQEYFGLTADRLWNITDSTDESMQIRRGMFDIWWARDYTRYGEAINKDFSDVNWPVSDKMFVYVRNDLAAQMWSYGLGDGTVQNPLDTVEVNSCIANWSNQAAITLFASPQTPFVRPLDIEVSDDGLIYVADESTNTISVFNQNGEYVSQIGASENILLQRPNAVGLHSDGSLYIADTWNYQIQVVGSDNVVVNQWGSPNEAGFEAQAEPFDGFWGPRDIDVDSAGNVYVADTGNKRIRVYDATGQYLRDIGSGGSGEGQLDEPASVAIHPDGRVFVADTWNRRISVFDSLGVFVSQFPIRGWYDDLGNRPYLALDTNRDIVYITDPEAGRVLVTDIDGNCLGSFGQPGVQPLTQSQFQLVGGIAVDAEGFVYVSDAAAGRVLKFAPFVIPEPPPADEQLEQEIPVEVIGEATDEVAPVGERNDEAVEESGEVADSDSNNVNDEIPDNAAPAENDDNAQPGDEDQAAATDNVDASELDLPADNAPPTEEVVPDTSDDDS